MSTIPLHATALPKLTAVSAGTRVVSTRSVPGGWAYYAPAVYVAVRRRDGTLTWRLDARPLGQFKTRWGHTMDTGFRSRAKARREAETIAFELGLYVVPGIRHGKPCA
jgi:hypothetical protein